MDFGVYMSATVDKINNTERIKKMECFWSEWKTDSKDGYPNIFFGTGTKYSVAIILGKALDIDIICLDFFECGKILDLNALLLLRCKNKVEKDEK